MSTMIMPQNTLYDFGDSLIKNGISRQDSNPLNGHLQVDPTHSLRLRLSKIPSSSTELAMILGNLAQQQQQQQQQQQPHRRLERTQSAPAPSILQQQQSLQLQPISVASVNTSRYKTELCRPYEEFGVCKYGDKCQFAHGIGELRSLTRHPKYKTELCRTYHTAGFCPYGPRCHFVHNQEEALMGSKNHHHHHPLPPTTLMLSRSNTAAALLQRSTVVRPSALSPSLSLDSPSPPCSLSQSPTSSMGSFFSSEPELHSPSVIDDQRLPVFNRLSTAQLLQLSELIL